MKCNPWGCPCLGKARESRGRDTRDHGRHGRWRGGLSAACLDDDDDDNNEEARFTSSSCSSITKKQTTQSKNGQKT